MAGEQKPEDIFLIVNPKSGGNRGKLFLNAPQPLIVDLDQGGRANLRIYSLLDGDSGNKPGFKALREALQKRTPLRVIVGGGDGTVMWADSEATKHGIDTSTQVLFGIVPLGTGNDFSRVAGWGGRNPRRFLDDDCKGLRSLVQLWSSAAPRPHDVWEVVLTVDESCGAILTVDSEKQESPVQPKSTTLRMPMINYFSIGQESKVGIEFDKHRTKSQTCNLLVYAWEGLYTEVKCCEQQLIGNLVAGLHAGVGGKEETLFDCTGDESLPQLRGNPESLMFLNVNSFSGGAAHFWSLRTKCAVQPRPRKEDVDVEESPGDGKIEVVTLPSILNIPLDQLSQHARRLHSGGPYRVEFFEPDEEDRLEAYCEVDGEYYHLLNPEAATVTLKKKLLVLQNAVDDSESEEFDAQDDA